MPASRSSVLGLVVSALALLTVLAAAIWFAMRGAPAGSGADPNDARQVAHGKEIYLRHCASCHGARLEGQPNWRERLPNGRLPAPPHDHTGHTWHHPDRVLFGITKYGVADFAPPGYQSDMPAFHGVLSDEEIWAVLAYIKNTWPEQARAHQLQATRRDANR